jgi:phosphatidylserine decarboxylase
MTIAREGFPFIFTAALLGLLSLVAGWKWAGLVLALSAFAFVGFFRDPKRIPPTGEGLILSPADGRVTGIKQVQKGRPFGEATTCVSIFLSPLDVHVNRAPVRGNVEDVRYQRGKFSAAYKEESSQNNEQNALRIVDARGRRLGVVQIAGVVARRIVCYVKKGDSLERGQKIGLIMFGSRVDLFLPTGSRVDIIEGQRVRGGETIIGRLL